MEVQKMEVNKTQWTQETVDKCNETGGTDFLTTFDSCCQPEFGIKIGWNEPKRLWRPFVVIRFWHYHIQIGWLF